MRKFPLILPSFLVFIAWLTYELKKNEKKKQRRASEVFKNRSRSK